VYANLICFTIIVITVGGGATWRDVYPFAQGKGRALVGAVSVNSDAQQVPVN
jgi:hypothetical protein